MSVWTTRYFQCLGMAVLTFMATDVLAQSPRAKVITWNAGTSGDIFVGILGEIAKPGVYRLDGQSLTLQTVIRRAGGLTDEASGTIRVVRQDRIVESVYFTQQSNNPLLPGDLLIVESARAQAAISRMYDADPRDRAILARAAEEALKATDSTGVQVAFVNVLDRPVIVKVKHENAKLAQVVQMLDQSVELAQDVRVIGPDRLISQSATPLPVHATLSNGSVLIFPRNAVNRRKLPTFPIPYESEIATGAIPSLIGGSSGQSPELRNVGQLPPLMARESFESARNSPPATQVDQSSIPIPPPSNTMTTPAPAERVETPNPTNPTNETPLVSTPPRIATVPFMGQPRVTTSTSQLKTNLEPDPDSTKQKETNQPPKTQKTMPFDSQDELLDNEDEPAEAAKSSVSFGQLFGIAACMGLLIGVALMTRRHLYQRELATSIDTEIESALYQQATESIELTQESDPIISTAAADIIPSPGIQQQESLPEPNLVNPWMDQLLANQLTIREEKPAFPSQIALQGRIVPPPVYRIDEVVTPQGPHFATEAGIVGDGEPSALPSRQAPEHFIDEFDGPHGSRPTKPHFMRRANQRTAATTAAGGQSGSVKPDSKLSITPVADALRQLQGDL